eukprot:14134189-Alexandrium_andersonii.AAC.1
MAGDGAHAPLASARAGGLEVGQRACEGTVVGASAHSPMSSRKLQMDDSFMDDDSSQRHHGQAQSGTHTHRDQLHVCLLPPPLQLAGDGAPAPLATAEVVDFDASQPAVDGTVAGSTTP